MRVALRIGNRGLREPEYEPPGEGTPLALLARTLGAVSFPLTDDRELLVATHSAPGYRVASLVALPRGRPVLARTPEGRPGVIGDGWFVVPARVLHPFLWEGWYAVGGDPRRADPVLLSLLHGHVDVLLIADARDDRDARKRAPMWVRLMRTVGIDPGFSILTACDPVAVRLMLSCTHGIHVTIPARQPLIARIDEGHLASLIADLREWGFPPPVPAETTMGALLRSRRARFVRGSHGIPRRAGPLGAVRDLAAWIRRPRGPGRASRNDVLAAVRWFVEKVGRFAGDDDAWERYELPLPGDDPVLLALFDSGSLWPQPSAGSDVVVAGWEAFGPCAVAPGALPMLYHGAIEGLERAVRWRGADDLLRLSFALAMAASTPLQHGLTMHLPALPMDWRRLRTLVPYGRCIGPKW